jgi:cephalosporin-C deacetylase-like acetyl esterase
MPPDFYPTPSQVDAWCARVLASADAISIKVTPLPICPYDFRMGVWQCGADSRYLAFSSRKTGTFHGYWQTVPSGGPAPTLIHLPGYGAEMSAHPELVAAGYNVLHVNPLGYATPSGPDDSRRGSDGNWPVLPDTAISGGKRGYTEWLRDAVIAANWLRAQPQVQPERLGVFGTSQGGGGALLLGSLLRERGCRAVAADQPFLTGFGLMAAHAHPGAYGIVLPALATLGEKPYAAAWRALGLIDTLSHAHRLTFPTLLTSGALDDVCPAATIEALFALLPDSRSYTQIAGQAHGYNQYFVQLARAWFGSFV